MPPLPRRFSVSCKRVVRIVLIFGPVPRAALDTGIQLWWPPCSVRTTTGPLNGGRCGVRSTTLASRCMIAHHWSG